MRRKPAEAGGIALLATAALLATGPAAAQPPPEIEAVFRIDPASQFATVKLDAAGRSAVERRVSRHLAELGANHFGFFRWRSAGEAGAAAAAHLVVTLRDEARPNGTDNVLVVSGRNAGLDVALPRLHPAVLYRWFELPKPSDPQALAADVVDRLDAMFDEPLRREVHQGFLKGVSLAGEVLADDADRQIIVPLSWEHVRADSGSVLRIEFVAAPQRPGEIELSLLKKRLAHPRPGALQGAIALFSCPPLTLSTQGAWDPEIPALLGNAEQVRVYMESYVRDVAPDVDDGLVVSPN